MVKIIEFFPNTEAAKEYPPVPVKMELPEWYKKMAAFCDGVKDKDYRKTHTTSFTIKGCMPTLDYMTSGYLLKTNTDIMISSYIDKETRDFEWIVPAYKSEEIVSAHPHAQCPVKIGGMKNHYIKIFSGWSIKTPAGYSCMVYQHHFLFDETFNFFSSIIDTDTYDGNFGMIGHLKNDFINKKIPAGTPLGIVLPFKRDEWEMKVSETVLPMASQNIVRKQQQYFDQIYKRFFHAKKRFD